MRDIMLILHFVGLAMGLGVSFAHLFLGIASSKMPPEEATGFSVKTLALSTMGHIGLTLLVVSGLYLMTPYWYALSSMPLLIAKLCLVGVLILLISVISVKGKKARQGDAASQLKKMKPLGQFTLITALLIVILAVSVFH